MAKTVKVSKKPTRKVKSLKLTRDGRKFTVGFSIPKEAVDTSKADRFATTSSLWELGIKSHKEVSSGGGLVGVNTCAVSKSLGTAKSGKDSGTLNINSFKSTDGWRKGKSTDRKDFYPCTDAMLDEVSVTVFGKNSKGGGPHESKAITPKPPDKPKVTGSYDADTGVYTATIEADGSGGELYDTRYRLMAYLSTEKKWKAVPGHGWKSKTSKKFTVKYDIGNYDGVDFAKGQWLQIKCEAYSRGWAGDSKTASTSAYKVVWPGKPVIQSITGNPKDSAGRVVVNVKDEGGNARTIELERMKEVPDTYGPSDVPAGGTWEKVRNAVGNNVTPALYDAVSDAVSAKGYYTWYRIYSERDNFPQYSVAKRADCLFVAAQTDENDTCGIVSATPGDDGESAVVIVGWKEDSRNTGTELSWSTAPDAWESTDPPDTFDFTWSDETSRDSGWSKTARVILRGLKEGEVTYVRARRFYDDPNAGRNFTAYSNREDVSPATRPASVVLEAPGYVNRGEDIEASWAFDSTAEQTEWHIHPAGNPKTSIAGGSDSMGAATIPASAYGTADSLSFFVSVGAGGNLTDSNTVTVGIADAPTLDLLVPSVMDAQPLEFTAFSDSSASVLLASATVPEPGISLDGPDGTVEQVGGDTIWTSTVRPAWTATTWAQSAMASEIAARRAEVERTRPLLAAAQAALDAMAEADSGYAAQEELVGEYRVVVESGDEWLAAHDGAIFQATVPLPTGLAFLDDGEYLVTASAKDEATGLSSPTVSARTLVRWKHQAPYPSEAIEVLPDPLGLQATIRLAVPEGYREGDVYDLYRVLPTGGHQIARSLLPTDSVVDRYAPYGTVDLAYRVCCRTPDGDIEWADFPYELDHRHTRIDFGNESLELELGQSFSSDRSKDFEARGHWGDKRQGGYLNDSIAHSMRISADVRTADAELYNLLERLGDTAEFCFVRTPRGLAFQANVDVSLDDPDTGGTVAAKLSATEVKLTEFMPGEDDITSA